MNQALVRYCYRCGKRVRRSAVSGRCWYCDAAIERVIRPARSCPYCDKEIGHRAIKCPHCKEFLDGDLQGAATQKQAPLEVHYHIDKAIIQQGAEAQLPGADQQALAGGPSMKQLPGPGQAAPPAAQDAVKDVEALPAADEDGEQRALVPQAGPGAAQVPAKVEDTALAKAKPAWALAKKAGGLVAKAGSAALQSMQDAAEVDEEEIIDAEIAEDRYRTCPVCQTEMLSSDNYCTHCGTLLRPEILTTKQKKPGSRFPAPVIAFYVCSVLMMAVTIFLYSKLNQEPSMEQNIFRWLIKGFSAASLLMILLAVFRRFRAGNLIVALVFLALWAFATMWVFPKS